MNGQELPPGQNRHELVSADTINELLGAINEQAVGLLPPESGELGINLRYEPDMGIGSGWLIGPSRPNSYGHETEGLVTLVEVWSEPENKRTDYAIYHRDGEFSLYATSPPLVGDAYDKYDPQVHRYEDLVRMTNDSMIETRRAEMESGFAAVYDDEARALLEHIRSATH